MVCRPRRAIVVLVQLVLPIKGLVTSRIDSRSHYSWNMYSRNYGCEVGYQLITPDGQIEMLDYRQYLARPSRASMLFHRDVLPAFHEGLCSQLRDEGRLKTLRGSVACRNDQRGVPTELIEANGNICEADNFGVGR